MGILRGGTTVGERWCPPTWKWATSILCPPSTKHVLRGWYIVYGGTDTYAGRIPLGWRYTCLLVGHVTTTAVLIHQLGEHRPISGGDITLGRRYTRLNDTQYLGWLVGATSYLGDTHLGWRYIWGWYTSSYDYLGDTQIGRRYTSYTEASLTWAIHILF